MLYSELTARLAVALNIDASTDADFAVFLPQIIQSAELRCYRDLDAVETRKTGSATLAPGASSIAIPPDWVIGNAVQIWPTAQTRRSALDRRTEDYIREYWPDPAVFQQGQPPKFWAEPIAGTLLIAPTAEQSYGVELTYTFRPSPMSSANPTTTLGDRYSDLFFAACMIDGAAYQKNFGASSDDPQMAVSWEAQYAKRLDSARVEVGRRKGEAYFDSSRTPPPVSIQPRGA